MVIIMNKILIVLVTILIIILVVAGYYLISSSENNLPNITDETALFDYSNEPVTNWNENSHEYKFHQKITSINNQKLENAHIDIIFYNHGKLIGIESDDINKTDNGTFDLDFTIKLDCEPDTFYYNVTDVNWV